LKIRLGNPLLVSARLEGQYGIVREVASLIDFNAPYCVILRQDAIDLGYPHAANRHPDEERTRPDRVPVFTSWQGIQRGIVVRLNKVTVGPVVASEVDAVVLELQHPRFHTFDFVLGRTFLANCKLTVDVKKGYVNMR
jgi:predicted aspartyl protease